MFNQLLQVMCTDSITTYCGCSSMEASRQRVITCSLGIMQIEASRVSKLYVFFWLIKSSTQRISSSYEGIMNVHRLIEYMASTMSVIPFLVSYPITLPIGKRRYQVKLWRIFADCFQCLPIACLIDDKILCMHGGLSPELANLNQIHRIQRPTDVPDSGLICDLLWSDPAEGGLKGWEENERGVSYVFGDDIVKIFNEKNQLDLICRAHQVVEDGYEFFSNRQLVTIFSAPNYCGEFDNAGITYQFPLLLPPKIAAMMTITENLMCSF